MGRNTLLCSCALSSALVLGSFTAAFAQETPGDQSGTPRSAGAGQSAASSTNAPVKPVAAAPADTGGNTMGEVIVTARRVEERLQDVPISITVFNQQQLNNRNIVQAQDLATYTPSLSSNNNFGNLNSAFAIRGFVQDIGTAPSVGVYFADVVAPRGATSNIPIGNGAGPGSFFDLQNVQVLKGPQGTLFGRNTTGGAVLLVPQKPTSKLEGYIEDSFGDYGLERIQGVINIPFSDQVRFRFGVDHESRNGYLENDTGIGKSNFDDIDYTALRGSLVVDITPNIENYTIASYLKSDSNGSLQKLVASGASGLGTFALDQLSNEASKGAGFYTVQNTLPNPFVDVEQWQVINTTTYRVTDNLTIKNIASYAEIKEFFNSAEFGTDFDLHRVAAKSIASLGLPASLNPYPTGTVIDFANISPLAGRPTADESTVTEELQVQGSNFDDRLHWQSGAYLELSNPIGEVGSQTPALLDCTNAAAFQCTNPIGEGSVGSNASKTYFHDVGIYAQGTYSITSKLKLTGGVRYTWDEESNDSQALDYSIPKPGTGVLTGCSNAATNFPSCAVNYHEASKAPTGLVDLDYKPIDSILAYAKYSRGYRAGGVTPQAPLAISTFQPEKVDAYEVGLKTEYRPLHATFNVAGFYNDFSNQQLQLGLNPITLGKAAPATAILNAGKSRIDGVEVEGTVSPFAGFTIEGGYTYLDTRINQITIPAFTSTVYTLASPAVVGDPLTLSPKNKVTVTASYQLPIDRDFGRVTVSATFTHTDSELSNYVDRTSTVPSIKALGSLAATNLLNLNLNWNNIARSPVDLQIFATNVSNQAYYTFVPGIFQTVGFETAQVGEPRMYGARLRYHFGN